MSEVLPLIKIGNKDKGEKTHEDFIKKIIYKEISTIESMLKIDKSYVNIEGHNGNPLHILLKEVKDEKKDYKIAKLLVDYGVNIYGFDQKLRTPLFYAVIHDRWDIVKLLLEKALEEPDSRLNITLNESYKQSTIRDLINPKFFDLTNKTLPSDNIESKVVGTLLKNCEITTDSEIAKYINEYFMCSSPLIDCEKLFQKLCINGYDKSIDYLLKQNFEWFYKDQKIYLKNTLRLVAGCGQYETFKLLLDAIVKEQDGQQESKPTRIENIVLLSLSKYCDKDNYSKALLYLLDLAKKGEILLDINGVVSDGKFHNNNNNALHYTISCGSEEINRTILKLGGSLAFRNNDEQYPVYNIPVELLKKHLDDCILWEDEDYQNRLDKPQAEVPMKFHSLLYHPKEESLLYHPKEESLLYHPKEESLLYHPKKESFNNFSETDVVFYLSRSQQYKHLLSHPVIVTFLLIKWHRCRLIYGINIFLNLFFLVSLFLYIFVSYAKVCSSYSFCGESPTLKAFLVLSYLFLIIRETLQIFSSYKNYLKNFENYLEIILLFITLLILLVQSPSIETRRLLSSISIPLGSFVLILLLGQHPTLFINVQILRKVVYNFTTLIMWYFVLIFGFVLSFYLLFLQEEANGQSIGYSFYQTIRMMTGDFSGFKYDTFGKKLILTVFILIITIILMNLLSGMAVSDIRMIKEDAEIMGLKARIKFLHNTEKLIIKLNKKNIFNGCLGKILGDHCLINDHLNSEDHLYQVKIAINSKGRVLVRKNNDKDSNNNCIKVCKKYFKSHIYVDSDISTRIKEILKSSRTKTDNSCPNCKKLLNKLELINKD